MIAEAQAVALEIPPALELTGLIVGTVSGGLTACERKLDLVGGVGLGMVFGLGVGLIRDVIMQAGNVYMIDSPIGIPVSVAVAVLVFFLHSPFEHRPQAIEWVDILAVAVFAAIGCDKAIVAGLQPGPAVLKGVFTGIGGGFLRDIALGGEPHIFRKGNWYAVCARLGSFVYWALTVIDDMDKSIVAMVSVVATIAARRTSLRFNLQTPFDVDLTPKVKETLSGVKHKDADRPARSRITWRVARRTKK